MRQWILAGLLLLWPAGNASAQGIPPASQTICEQAGTEAERAFNLPSGLLLAIGRVESGRWDAARRRVVPWPWAVGTPTAGNFLDGKGEAIAAVQRLQAGGARNVDVGCFQINLMHHPNAFRDLEQAFDPVTNARYAAGFLASLQARLGSWDSAIETYHSANLTRGIPYRRLVQASWTDPADGNRNGSAQPYIRFGIRIWTPSGTGSGNVVAAGTGLPRIIVPGH